ncbi:MAG: 16S rRNA (cytosine967-C5)-methyltransferase [Candidatus Endobugula sp.]|jgi:16S rRNA (cytosine967-C5)-methyltransferase
MNHPLHNIRTITVKILLRLLQQKGSLASELPIAITLNEKDKRLTHELCYGVCRWYFLLEHQLNGLIDKPLKNKDKDIHLLLLLGLYQLQFTRVAAHAAINETVNAAMPFRKPWAKKLINGVLRSFQRQQSANGEPEELDCPDSSSRLSAGNINDTIPSAHKIAHPQWLQEMIVKAWPTQSKAVFAANNQHPPFTLRVNQQHYLVDDYQALLSDVSTTKTLYSDVGLTLSHAVDVKQLPGFTQGHSSVQDEAAQLAAGLLQLAPQQRVLDACCAPGGKTCHIGEQQPNLTALIGVDLEQRRLARVEENIQRVQVDAQIICGDGTRPNDWWDGQLFDRILLDAPCSATGVIRRHPDIKLLRHAKDINAAAELQLQLLNALWPLLADGGILVYATCSVLPQENTDVIGHFIANHSNAKHDVIEADWGMVQPYGRQLLPQINGHDGFYYARLIKAL